jgi:DNA-binding transcriptional regulator GbsR (MarR family)
MVQLTPVQEKLFNYLASHKRPVPIAKLVHHFLISTSVVGSELRALHLMGLADRTKIKRKFFYEIKQ